MNITITGMSLDGHQVPVPTGFSELLNASGSWVNQKPESVFSHSYDRRVEKRNGNLVTVLTLKEEEKR
jgi:hypothetical protein